MTRPSDDDLPTVVHELAEPLAASHGIEVLDVAVRGQRGSRMVRLTADTADLDAPGGLDVDVMARFSRELGEVLDEHDPIAGGYTLEVTSPGADRPLTRARDFARNRGREVRITTTDTEELLGDVAEVTASTVTIATADGVRELSMTEIERGAVVLPW